MSANSMSKIFTFKKPIDVYIAKQYEEGDEVDIPKREVNFSTDVEDYSVDVLLGHINKLQEIDAKKPVTIMFNSPGGEVAACFRYYDLLKRFTFKVNSMVAGSAMSAATVMSIGTTGRRFITKNSSLMIHEISSWPMGAVSKLKNKVKYADDLQERIITVYVEHTNLKDRAKWKKIMENETYYNSKDALDMGLVDEIV